jgi:hypothetical protein
MPDPKKIYSDVHNHWDGGDKQPLAIRSSCDSQRSNQGVSNQTEESANVDSGAAGTNSERMAREKERTLRSLMTNLAERAVDDCCHSTVIVCTEQGCASNQSQKK